MQKDLVEQMLVSTECILYDETKEYGTGILIPSVSEEYDFVFTSLHCLKGKGESYNEDNEFNLFNKLFGTIECFDDNIYIVKELDIAIVKVNKKLTNECVKVCEANEGDEGCFIGFPQIKDSNRDEIEELKIKFVNNRKIKLKNDEVYLGREKPVQAFGGFSGSPVLIERCDSFYLGGIIIKLFDSKFIFKDIIYVSIDRFYNLIKDNNLIEVRDRNPNIIKECVDKVFISEEAQEICDLLTNYARKLSILKVEYFAQWLKEKMFLPYGNYSMTDDNVWIGWLKFLTFMYLIADKKFINLTNGEFDEKEFLEYIKKNREEGVKYFHSYECKTFQDLLPILYTNYNVYKDLNSGDAIISNFGTNKPEKAIIRRDDIPNVVKNIAYLDDKLLENDMDITSPSINKSLDVLHIYYFEKKILKEWNYETGKRNLLPLIKKCANEVISSVKGVQ